MIGGLSVADSWDDSAGGKFAAKANGADAEDIVLYSCCPAAIGICAWAGTGAVGWSGDIGLMPSRARMLLGLERSDLGGTTVNTTATE